MLRKRKSLLNYNQEPNFSEGHIRIGTSWKYWTEQTEGERDKERITAKEKMGYLKTLTL